MSARRAIATGIAVVGAVAVLLGLTLGTWRYEVPPPSASRSALPTAATGAPATATSPAAATTPPPATGAATCQNTYQAGDVPIVAPRRSGQHLEVALEAVRPGRDGNNRWFVRFFVPAGAPGPAEIPLRATVTGPAGPLQTGAYEAGPPNAGTAPLTQPATLQPCAVSAPPGTRGVVLVGVETAPVRSGSYTLTWTDIRHPEGGLRTETWTVTLACAFDPGPATPPATSCR